MKIIANRKKTMLLSLMVILVGAAFIIVNAVNGRGAFNYDVEFSGGTSMQIDIGQEFDNGDIIQIITDTTGQASPQVQRILGTTQVAIKILSVDQETRVALMDAISEKYGLDDTSFLSTADVSATISSEMQKTAVMAIAMACAAMLIYVSLRFRDLKTGGSAILALVHDVLIVVAFYGILRIPLNYSFIAVVLTILGYSINATIIVFDRMRENKRLNSRQSYEELIDKSINQTLRRSIFTSLTTLLTITCVYILGVPSIKTFSLPIIIGIVAGTYSSVFLAGSFWYILSGGQKRQSTEI